MTQVICFQYLIDQYVCMLGDVNEILIKILVLSCLITLIILVSLVLSELPNQSQYILHSELIFK